MSHTVAVGAVRGLAAAAKAAGVDGDAIALRYASQELLDDPDGRLSFKSYLGVLHDFVDECGITIGLRSGAMAGFGSTWEYVARTSDTLGGALRSLQRYARLASDRGVVDLRESDEEFVMEIEGPIELLPDVPTRVVRQSIEGFLALVVSVGRAITTTPWNPREVRFTYQKPDDVVEAEAYFGAPLRFGAVRSGLILDPSLLKLAVVTADTRLNQILAASCATLLQELPAATQDIAVDLMRRLTQAIPRGQHSIEQVARDLGMSVRTLQRRLAADGHNFNDVLDETRRLLAMRYLEESTMSLADTALLLGYSEPRAFQRAFKRWSGETPADYRAARR